jgi:hypothetical protein
LDKKLEWRVYYADGTTFDSEQGAPEDAPGTRVVLIIQRHSDPRERPFFQWMKDYYVWKHERWFAVDQGAFMFYIFTEKYPCPKTALAGETVTNEMWLEIQERAKVDPDFFQSSGRR